MLPLIPLALSLAPYLTRALAGDRAGDTAQAVAQAVQTAAGTDDPAQAEATLAADPGARADLMARLAEIGVEGERIAAADRADARARDLALQQGGHRRILPGAVLLLGTIGAGGAGLALVAGGLDDGGAAQAAFIQALTVCLGIVVLAAQFEWGSSRGSRIKDEASQGPFGPGKG
jgi:hypothetical protein